MDVRQQPMWMAYAFCRYLELAIRLNPPLTIAGDNSPSVGMLFS
jgi:hypothetical protein